ncbi:response regulator transcription factor [Micrococcus luteus]|uniref:response regulator transcription factor n=1 Tax=Micrococcus luteus TaxID=1270 RepID=UPI00378CA5D0
MIPLLLIEDEERIAAFVTKGFAGEGFAVTTATTGAEGIALAMTGAFDLAVLDLGLPDLDGFEVLARIRRQEPDLPVIILTARSSAQDTVAGLTSGADDYMPKPFRFAELLARVRLRLRSTTPDPARTAPPVTELRHGDLVLDTARRLVTVAGATVDLSEREFALAEEFLRSPALVLSRAQLLAAVWGGESEPGSNVVDVYVRYLRAKLGAHRIVTVRGHGYRLATERELEARG